MSRAVPVLPPALLRLLSRPLFPVLLAASVAAGLAAVPALSPPAEGAQGSRPSGAPETHSVTLVTGDVVRVSTRPGGHQSVTLAPNPDGSTPKAAISQSGGHLYVVPVQAFGLLAAHRLDRSLFDVTELIADGYDDASRDTLPVLVDYGRGATAARQSRSAELRAADRTVVVPLLGIAAFRAAKDAARTFWDDLTVGADRTGAPTGLSDGARRVMLDGQVTVALEDSVPQIHAPQAWAAGYDGSGVTVAVLDTGYDATHPDLQGRVVGSANFTDDPSVVDGNGHGTHVASTVAGSGAASSGRRRGVAPGADLLIGKVLADGGTGEDSMVLAGMQWAVAQGADVVSMSLGGDTDDGTNPLSQAVDELSASSDTLFVVAAGNNGFKGPSSVSAPGAADAALTVGAVDVNDAMAGFSGRGPRYGRFALKPEVVAPGVDVTAAQAAGTDLGDPGDNDPLYTTLSGTSMATPHVAGLAAILKQEHPGWDGERLKDVIADSTVPISNATGFDAGTGRIDAAVAIEQDVVAPASLALGSYRWPYADLAPTSTPLTYTNTSDAALTLTLALTGEDGSPLPDDAMSLDAGTLTVPAHGQASVGAVVDPGAGSSGDWSGVVTATPDDGGPTVRTVVGYQIEPERYDVTVRIRPRAGTVAASHLVGLSGWDDWSYDQRTLDAAPGIRSVTYRVAPGSYSVGAVTFGLARDGAQEGVVAYQPQLTVDHDTTVVLREPATRRFGYDVDRPVAVNGTVLDVGWDGPPGHTGYLLYGAVDRAYALPLAGGRAGSPDVAATFALTQPEGALTPAGGEPVSLRPVTSGEQKPWTVPVSRLHARLPIVDAGSVSALRTRHAKGAVALVAGTCTDLSGSVGRLAAAGARAVVAYADKGEQCAGTLSGPASIPVMQARPFDVAALLRADRGRLVTRRTPAYMYDLTRYWPDEVPAGATVAGTGRAIATVVEHYRGPGSTTADGVRLVEEPIGFLSARDGAANIAAVQPVSFPSTVTHYLSAGAKWERGLSAQDATWGGEYAHLWAPPRTFTGGTTLADTWLGGPIGSRVSPLQSLTNGAPPSIREGNEMFFTQGAFTDPAGHYGQSDLWSPEYSGKLFVDGKQELDAWASVFLSTTVPAGPHWYRLVTDFQRENAFWRHSTRIRTQWGFSSAPSAAADVVLPLLGVDYRMPLSATGSAPAGGYDFDVVVGLPAPLRSEPLVKHSVAVSWNGGATWVDATTTGCASGTCHVHVRNRPGRTAALLVTAVDGAGNQVRQRIVDAYEVRGG